MLKVEDVKEVENAKRKKITRQEPRGDTEGEGQSKDEMGRIYDSNGSEKVYR